MSYDTIYHFSRFTIIATYWAFMKESDDLKIEESESELEVLCTDSTALVIPRNLVKRRLYVGGNCHLHKLPYTLIWTKQDPPDWQLFCQTTVFAQT
jgi:ketosteroid isomerase-like protein